MAWTKNGEEIVAWHLFQSFDMGEIMTPQLANEIGQKLAREIFGNHVCVISTHTNTDNIHNHIVVCAWDKDGHKWHDNYASKRLIRKVSDRLCEEYGLSVLYKTQDMKMISYVDSQGNNRHFEPTDRKIELIRKRESGEIRQSDVNSHRNTTSFERAVESEKPNRAVIQYDIDTLLPDVRSYEELLNRLRGLGYTINDTKKNGGWLKHITFTAPLQGKGTCDYKLGDGEFYTRRLFLLFA